MFSEQDHVGHAQTYTQSAMRSLKSAVENIQDAIDTGHDAQRIIRLNALAQQVWAMEDLARSVEHQLAQIHAEIRSR
jgi:hypothetical protein